MTAGSLPAVTVLIDKDDHPAWTATAHAAHDPAIGRLTVDPSPANGAPAALAHDLLSALGKRLPQGGETYGTWADSQRPAWDAVAAWILTHGIGHLIVCRSDRLTTARQRQLLALRERCGIRLTLLWRRAAPRPGHAPRTDPIPPRRHAPPGPGRYEPAGVPADRRPKHRTATDRRINPLPGRRPVDHLPRTVGRHGDRPSETCPVPGRPRARPDERRSARARV